MEHHTRRVQLTYAEKRKKVLRGKSAHDKRVITFREHQNREAWYRHAPQESYYGIADVEADQEFINMELLIHAYDADIREIADDYFKELEEEYEFIQWGDSP